ncbi:MAG: hypothetical protein IJQ77_02600 [Synergistaceae bacterium]|nr:hypothetical protein [Synergistaceae bacterium]
MRRIMTALIFSVLAVFCAVSSEAAYTTKLTLIISRPSAPKVSEDKISSDGTFHGTVDLSEVYTDSHGRRTSETHTLFTNRTGIIMMSADVRITLNSDDYKALSGEKFAETVSVDSVIELYDSDYDSYTYSLDVKGLPEWLKVSGETSYDDAISIGVSEYHHEFVIAGTPDREYDAANIIFTALIFVSGDYPAMLAKGSMDVNISAGTIPKLPDVVPKSDDISPDVVPKSDDKFPDTIDTGGNGAGTESKTLAEALSNMTQEQKSAVKVLKIGANITSLEGLEEFTNLEELDLEEALSLESLNLSGNSPVKNVYIAGNTILKSLNLTGSRVEFLDASNCESLAELNIAGCKSLVYLDVSGTSITTLNADGCTNLSALNCSNCGIEELSLAGCDSLNILDCSYNSLHMLNAYMFKQLNVLRCENQVVYGPAMGRVLDILQYFDGISASANGDYTSGSGIESGIKNVINLRAFDSSGREISSEYDKETGIASFSEEPAKVTYDYITGFENVNMDVTIYPAYESGGKKESRQPGNPGGCNAISILPLFAAMIILVTGIRRHFYRRI